MMKRRRPQALPSVTVDKRTHCGKIYVTITFDKAGNPFECFVRFGRAGHCGAAVFDAVTKLVSKALRCGMAPGEIIDALAGIRCSYGSQTCMNAVAQAIRQVLPDPPPEEPDEEPPYVDLAALFLSIARGNGRSGIRPENERS